MIQRQTWGASVAVEFSRIGHSGTKKIYWTKVLLIFTHASWIHVNTVWKSHTDSIFQKRNEIFTATSVLCVQRTVTYITAALFVPKYKVSGFLFWLKDRLRPNFNNSCVIQGRKETETGTAILSGVWSLNTLKLRLTELKDTLHFESDSLWKLEDFEKCRQLWVSSHRTESKLEPGLGVGVWMGSSCVILAWAFFFLFHNK